MKAKWGALVVDGRGKLGGHVASRNSAGAYFRTKVTPVNPSTPFQETARARFGILSQAWRALTDAQRASWNSSVGEFAKTDIFGDLKNPSGFNLFQRLNNNLANVLLPAIDSAPLPQAVLVVAPLVATIDIGLGDVYETTISAATPASSSTEVWATPPQSPGKSFVKSEFRLIHTVGGGEPNPLGFKPEYISRFGIPPVGSLVFILLKFINNVSGQASPVQQISTIVVDT
jgi:hypothetical protein